MKHNAEVALRALLKGLEVPLFDCLVYYDFDHQAILAKMCENEKGCIGVPFQVGINEFIKASERMSEEDRLDLVFRLTLLKEI